MRDKSIQFISASSSALSIQHKRCINSKVAILLSTYNGEQFLGEQLNSIIEQNHQSWFIVASDDGSCDSTVTILENYQYKLGNERLIILRGPRQGFATNFLSMLRNESIQSDYFAFCDQDDIWHPDKLTRAITWLSSQKTNIPTLYCSRTRLVNSDGHAIGLSPLFSKSPSFKNALVQSLAGGNTMVFNNKTRELVLNAGNFTVVSHDWWIYLLTSGSGGLIYYDSKPSLDYRQHSANLVGSNSSLRDRLVRMRFMLEGRFNEWNDINISALANHHEHLTHENRNALKHFSIARRSPLHKRILGFFRSGIYRQTRFGTLGLIVAAIIGKI